MGDWNDVEIEVFQQRAARLVSDGMSEPEAESLAQEMLYRDRPDSGDNRRICLECRRLQRRVCSAAESLGLRWGMEPVRTVLQRCDAFVLRGVSC